MKQTTSDRLKQLMEMRNLRQADILEMIEPYCQKYGVRIPRNALSQYVTGKVIPKQDKLTILGMALNVSEIWLMGYDVPMEYPTYDMTDKDTIRIPILGTVAAGYNYFAEQNYIGELQAEGTLSPGGDELFALQIKGDSMSPRIMEGDTVIVSKTAKIDTGDIVIALVNGEEATCKRLQKFTGGIALVPLNPNYQPMFFSDEQIETLPVKIIGKVIENRQKF